MRKCWPRSAASKRWVTGSRWTIFTVSPRSSPLIQFADYIKLDYRALGEDGFAVQVRLLRRSDARLIAEKIESEAEFLWLYP